MEQKPVASVIVAAYNRADVLRYAIKSVIRSTHSDWELLIVGDNCTDHTEEMVLSFADPRIKFQNLAQNSGGQSAPNNAGIARATGKYVLFLNQDDMYFADHIVRAISHMEETGADIAWSPVILLQHSGLPSGPPDPVHDRLVLDGAVQNGDFDPRVFAIASSWIVRREVCLTVGPWLSAESTRLSPSQEWLFRAWRKGKMLNYHPYPSVLCIHAGARRLSYLASSSDHERAWTWVTAEDGANTDLLRCVALCQAGLMNQSSAAMRRLQADGVVARFKERAVNVSHHFGIHPAALRRWLDGEPKGKWVADVRAFASEAQLLLPNQNLRIGDTAAELYLVRGWHNGDSAGRWTSERCAEIIFRLDPADCNQVLELSGHTLRLPDHVTFSVNGQLSVTHCYTRSDETVQIELGRMSGNIRLSITVENPTSPHALSGSNDTRTLGMWISSMRLINQPATDHASTHQDEHEGRGI